MVLNNFKSYAVVGPNGSGKSNVIDALLFVFGYRANKMRQGKLSELIHNSAKYPNLASCSVEIHFQEIIDGNTPTEFEKVPNSRLMISRHAYRNNSSKYHINEKTSSYTEVTTLLRKRGIDLDHKRFLILQGEVESIALMKPKAKDDNDDGLLEYLEDIIGTSKYKEPIESANKRLEELNEDRVEKLNRARYVGKEKDSLEGKKCEAEMFLENENELARKKNELYQVYIYEAKDNISVANTAVDELKRKLEEEKVSHVDIEKEQTEMSTRYQGAVKEYDALSVQMSQVKKKQSKFEKDEVQLRERRDHLVNKNEKSKAALEKDQEARIAARDAIKKNGDELVKKRKDLKELEKQLKREEAKMEEINRELTGKTDEYKAQIEELQKERAPWTEKINKKKKDIDVRKSEKEILEEKMSSGTKAREGNCRKELSLARQKADDAKASLQQSQSRGKVFDSLLRMRDSGRIKGIYDRLGNLGVIDDKYDVAVSTACPALDNIVVETVEAGQACIEYLRKNNLGRAVFTILDKLGRQDTRSINTPENVPRLFDLIRPKHDRFSPAFYSVLRDTLVADNLKQANRIAYGRERWRVVTLDGKLIEKSGAMTGGGNRQLRGAMGSSFKDDEVSADTVAKLEREQYKLEEELRNIVEEKRASELALRSKKESLPRKEMTLEKLQMDMDSLDRQLEDARTRRDTLKTQMEPSPEDVKRHSEIGHEIEKLENDMAELEEKPAEIDEQIQSLQEEIMDAGGMDLRLQKIVVDDVNKRIENLNSRITKAMVAKAKAEKDVVKLESSIKKYEQEDGKIDQDIKKLEAESAQKAKEAAGIIKQVEELNKDIEKKKKEIDKLKNDLDDKTKQINELRKSEIEIKNKLENYQRSLADNQRKVVHWNEQRTKLSLHNYKDQSEEELHLPEFDDETVKELQKSVQAIKTDIAEIEALVENAKPNLSVLEEYRRREEEYNGRVEELNDVTSKRDEVKNEAESLRKQRLDEFMQGFNIISQKLKEMYQMITMGGNAELELVDSLDPFSEGIVFSVMPPKKSWKNISNLSGGEKVTF
ncbi:hypothetical protein BDB00DRAFT_774953 [Zychaea mexicana]|uniref:uncharacterized protein n=1 Tax=Zychaea mexicana TaxID=64656 RepID=UPI0022FF3700|nr:uncharacterized protein BDB00DRAFT_774953 [Zychaea mexicana]KAI9484434.1 hypothetical protein BDB00DRAFT_774953 [Zychaea mexicana]